MSIQNIALIGNLFVAAADQPWEEDVQASQTPEPSCTVRLNRFEGEKVPVDERYLNTPYADENSEQYDSGLFYEDWWWSGITYEQHHAIEDKVPTTQDVSFQAEAGLGGWYMPDGYYHKSVSTAPGLNTYVGSAFGVQSVLYDTKYTNWTHSAEVDIDDPQTCLNIRNELDNPLPNFTFHGVWGDNANTYAERVWAHTGFPSDFETLEKTDGVTIIDRETRIAQDLESGQLKKNYDDIPAPWKPD